MARIYRTGKIILVFVTCALLLGGCGNVKAPETVTNDSLVIGKDGVVTSYTVGIFDKEYYKVQELRVMAQQEASAYNTAHQTGTDTPVIVEKVDAVEGQEGKVVVAYRFNSADTYVDYNNNSFYYGTIGLAKEKGYDLEGLNQVLFDVKGRKSMVSSELTADKMAGKHIILAEEPTYVYCPYQVAYISEGARIREDGSVDTTGVEPEAFPVIILMNK